MSRALVVANWKMHGSSAFTEELLAGLLRQEDFSAAVAICPPFPYLALAAKMLAGSSVAWGGQNVSEQASGAYTGEVAASMLKDLACQYVIVGHSERRALYGETDAIVAAKLMAAQEAGVTPILCVGESLQQREHGETLAVVSRQLKAVFDKAGIAALKDVVIAYEPVWAIGTGQTASPEQAQEVHAYIRQLLAQYEPALADGVSLLYGGSVKANNAEALFAQRDIDGALVGGASLNVDEFASICEACG